MAWPDWWDWELEISVHCLKRMQERGFHEGDLRAMLDDATDVIYQDHGTWLVVTSHDGASWEVIVVPEHDRQLIVLVTAYEV